MSYRWRPSKAQKQEYARKMQEIEEFCVKNGIQQSYTRIIEIYNDLKAGYQLDGRGNRKAV